MSLEAAPSLDSLVELFPQYSRDTIVRIIDSVGTAQAFDTLLTFDSDGPARGGTVQADASQFHSEMFRTEIPAASQVAPPEDPAAGLGTGLHPDGLATWLECSSAATTMSTKRPRIVPSNDVLRAAYTAFSNSCATGQQFRGGYTPFLGGKSPSAAHAVGGSYTEDSYASTSELVPVQLAVAPAKDMCVDACVPWEETPSCANAHPVPAFEPISSGVLVSTALVPAMLHATDTIRSKGNYMTPPVQSSCPTVASSPTSVPVPIHISLDEGEPSWIDLTDSPIAELWNSEDTAPHAHSPPTCAALLTPSEEGPESMAGGMAVGHLQAMFPETDAAALASVLHRCGGSTEEALEMLIAMNSEDSSLLPCSPPISICGSDSVEAEEIPREQKLALLGLQFQSLAPAELAAALDGESGSLEDAAALLHFYAEEDEAEREAAAKVAADSEIARRLQHAEGSGSGRGPATTEAQLPSHFTRALLPGLMTPSGRGALSPAEQSVLLAPGTEDVRFAAKVKHLHSSFPTAAVEEIAAALVRADNNPLPAKKILTERGFVEVIRSAVRVAEPAMVQPNRASLEDNGYGQLKVRGADAGASKQLSYLARRNRDHQQRQAASDQLYQEARAPSVALYKQANDCFRRANLAYRAADNHLSDELTAEGHDLKQRAREEGDRAADTISRVKNRALKRQTLLHMELHGLHVDEAISKLRDMLASLQGIVSEHVAAVRVITGRGNHSGPDGPRLLPAVKHFLDEQRVRYIDGIGFIDIPIGDD